MHPLSAALSLSLLLSLLLFALVDSATAGQQCALKPPKSWYAGGDGDGGGSNSTHGGGGGGGNNSTSSTGGDDGGSSSNNNTVPDNNGGGGNSTSGATGPCVKDKVKTGWYTGWHQQQFPLDQLSWDKYTIVTYAFATTTPDAGYLFLGDSDKTILHNFVSTAHKYGVKAALSLGGWGGSQYFSTAVASAENRTAFVSSILDVVSTYDLDGIDFDWEYPGRPGSGSNVVSPEDSSRFLQLLQELRGKAPKDLVVSAAVSLSPFAGSDGWAMSNVSAFAKVLDYIEIMVYDITGSWDERGPGPNAPLNDTCSHTKTGSAVSAVNAWTSASFPIEKIVLGVASYGHAFNISADSSAAFKSTNERAGCSAFTQNTGWDGSQGYDACGNPVPSGGIWNFNALVSGGYLDDNGNAAKGVDYRYDECSQTPYIYGAATQTMVTYDDPRSFAVKGNFIKTHGLKGFAMWEVAADYGDLLVDSITNAAKC